MFDAISFVLAIKNFFTIPTPRVKPLLDAQETEGLETTLRDGLNIEMEIASAAAIEDVRNDRRAYIHGLDEHVNS
jgi:hypothetical protein